MARALQDSVEMLQGLAQDIKFTIRIWARNPGMAITCVLILAIGLGASAAVFSLVHALLIKPLPYPDPEKLVVFERISPRITSDALSPLTFQDLTSQSDAFQSSSAYTNEVMTLTGVGEPQRLNAMLVSWNFFDMIQIQPALGRFFQKSEGISGAERVVVLGYSLWQRSFSGDRGIVGRPIQLEGRSYVVMGIAPPKFDFPDHTDVWRPLVFDPLGAGHRAIETGDRSPACPNQNRWSRPTARS
jgi:putative ABC transport system permease protein